MTRPLTPAGGTGQKADTAVVPPGRQPLAAPVDKAVAAPSDKGRTAGSRAQARITLRRRARSSTVLPWMSADTTTAKKTMLKKWRLRGTLAITANVARTTGTAPRRPAQL